MKPNALSRYEIRRELGRGGTGVVYEAYDSKDRSVVAVKTIESSAAEHLYRLKHEFRALADVQHPNLVRFGELTCEEGEWFFTMELVPGTEFIEYVRGQVKRPAAPMLCESGVIAAAAPTRINASADLEDTAPELEGAIATESPASSPSSRVGAAREQRLRDALAQLVAGLSAIHDAGHVHRDIKPSNVLVTEDGRVVILDFGLVAFAAGLAPGSSSEPWLVGTPAYMAPELIQELTAGPAADWYAVGVMLFTALTGVLPFDGNSGEAVMKAKLEREPPSPADLTPGLPPDLCALAVDLLRLDPEARPRGDEIRARVGLTQASSSPALLSHGGSGAPFVGRDAELGVLARAFEEVVAERTARAVIVEGEPGIGKSSLVGAFLRARGKAVNALTGRCYEQEDVPFKGIDGIVDALSEHLLARSDDDVETLIRGGIRYLTALFPVLKRVPKIAAASIRGRAVGNPAAIREQAFREFEELVDALGRDRAVILFVDDLQWADRDSIALLARVVHHARRSPVLFVATMRSGADIAPEVAEFVSKAERLRLSRLSADESRALLDALWETGDAGRHPKDGLLDEAEGHPLFLAELARTAGETQSSRVRSVALQQVLWDRIRARDAVDQRFLEMMAVGGAPIPYEVIAAAAGVDPGEAQTRLGSLRAAQLVRVSRRGGHRTVEPYHDRVRESILLHLRRADGGAPALIAMHTRLARALHESTPPAALAEQVFSIVHHFNAAAAGSALFDRSERVKVAGLNLLASREALRATAYERARGYARAGIALLGDEGWSDAYEICRDLHFERMWAESFADDPGESPGAESCFRTLKEHVQSESDRTDLLVGWISLQTMRRQLPRALAAGRERLAELGVRMPERVTLGMLRSRRAAIRHMQRGRTTDELLLLPDLRSPIHIGIIKTLVALVPVAFFVDANLRAWMHLTAMLLSVEHGMCEATSYAISGYGSVLSGIFDEHAEGASFGLLALAMNERFQNEKFAAKIVFHYGGWHAPWMRPFVEAKEMLRAAYDLAREHGDTTHETYAATVLSLVAFSESEALGALAESAAWAMDVGLRRKDLDMAGVPEVHGLYAAALRGETAGATDLGREGTSDDELRARFRANTPTALFHYLFCKAELAYLAGDALRADALLKEAVKGVHVIFGLSTTVDVCFLESLVAAKLHDGASFEEKTRLEAENVVRLRRLRKWARTCAANFEPYCLVASAELARIRGAVREAGAAYERAITASRLHRAPKREAIALELAASHALMQGERARAELLRAEAASAYRRWGAVAKAIALDDE